jgi:membrane-bound lytic murein transglycosylase D
VLLAASRVDGGHESLRKGQARHVHVVARGDSLSAISRKTGVPVATLASLNGVSASGALQPGQKLKLPSDAGYDDPPPRSAKAAAKPAKGSFKPASQGEARGRSVSYVVRAGDTLYSISRALQVTVDALRGWNKLGANDAIHPGQKLVAFPRGGG